MNIRRQKKGSVLVITLWILVCVSLIALGFGRRARLEMRAAAYEMDNLTARHLAHSAAGLGAAMLRKNIVDAKEYDSLKDQWAEEQEVSISELMGDEIGERLSEGCTVSYVAVDEDRKININKADGKFMAGISVLPRGLAVAAEMRRAGSDEIWGSNDDIPFTAPEEVLTLAKIDEDDWFGDPDDDELNMCDVITTYGSAFVNINTAPLEILTAVPELSKRSARAIVRYRRGGDGIDGTSDDRPFPTLEDTAILREVSDGDISNMQRYCRTHSSAYTVTGKAVLHNGRVTATAQVAVLRAPTGMIVFSWREGWISYGCRSKTDNHVSDG